jgi:hypothetical protein
MIGSSTYSENPPLQEIPFSVPEISAAVVVIEIVAVRHTVAVHIPVVVAAVVDSLHTRHQSSVVPKAQWAMEEILRDHQNHLARMHWDQASCPSLQTSYLAASGTVPS